jgi:hypothetical protein
MALTLDTISFGSGSFSTLTIASGDIILSTSYPFVQFGLEIKSEGSQ